MSPKQYAELLEYISLNNCWGDKMYDITIERKRNAIKYVDAVFDSRDGKVWSIKFRSCTNGEDTTFRIEEENDVKKIYTWLDKTTK